MTRNSLPTLSLALALTLTLTLTFMSCKDTGDDTPQLPPVETESLYFPGIGTDEWATSTPDSLGWDTSKLDDLYTFMADNKTRAFLILKDGKIVVEKYWGKDILNINDFGPKTNWYWASAGKTVTSFLVGMAQEEGKLNISDKTSDYLGKGWTSMDVTKEDLITIRHQLTMTTGADYTVNDIDCTDPGCIQYKADAGTQWYYHNAMYTLLESVVSKATSTDYNDYTDRKLEQAIGIENGIWIKTGYNNVYWSRARDAARFGLLILNKGRWGNTPVMTDTSYFNAMVTTSQQLNPSYGYLWWLNGKSSIVYPGLPTNWKVSLSEAAPSDLFAAMGKNGQFIDIVPSQNLVVIRMGEAPDGALVPVQFHNEMWEKIMGLM
ncbi:MAG: serine hydrolase [Flavobacteriales bacterium]|nr:serine hydrolase [Bacteroidota bacterium]MCB9240168.1 serine hydrolase [Flavobacteriales bacterium]